MIKRTITYAALALLTLGFAACQQEEDFAPQEQEIRISFTTDAIQTRVNTLGTGNVWENGDEILVLNTANNESVTFKASVSDVATQWSQDKSLYWNGSGENTLLASYPSGCEYGTFVLPTDQSDEQKLKAADFMNAYCVGSKNSGMVNLQMKHRMAMITVTYSFADNLSGSQLSKAEIRSTSSAATFDYEAGGEMEVNGLETWVDAYIHDNKITAIVVPGTYNIEDELMRVTVAGGVPLTVRIEEEFTLQGGDHYIVNLTVDRETIDLSTYTGTELTISGKAILTGSNDNLKVILKDGADVILKDASITNTTGAAISSESGNSKITLRGNNTLCGTNSNFDDYGSGISVFNQTGTLTIDGDGDATLIIDRKQGTNSFYGAGIGIRGGNLVINGGNITINAVDDTSKRSGAGIGTSDGVSGVSGSIIISGGNVTIGQNGTDSAAIGGGSNSSYCGITIRITGGNTQVTATKSPNATCIIGKVTSDITIGAGATVNGVKYAETHTGEL